MVRNFVKDATQNLIFVLNVERKGGKGIIFAESVEDPEKQNQLKLS